MEKRTRVLYQFICANNIQEKLKIRELEFKAAGNTAMEREYGQIYGIIMNLLDKLVEVLGTETIRIAHYQGDSGSRFSGGAGGVDSACGRSGDDWRY